VALLLMPFVLSNLQQIERGLVGQSSPPQIAAPAAPSPRSRKQSASPITPSSSPHRAVHHPRFL
jgi:hypothetical protein